MKDIRRPTRKQYSAEEKIRIVLDGLRGEHGVAELCRREGAGTLLGNYYLPGDLEARIDAFVDHYNHRRYHESLGNLTPADEEGSNEPQSKIAACNTN